MCCSVLQCVAVPYSVLQCVAVCCCVLQRTFTVAEAVATCMHTSRHRMCEKTLCNTVQHVETRSATHCNTLQRNSNDIVCQAENLSVAEHIALQHATTQCNTLPCTATRCNTLQRTDMHANQTSLRLCNTMQHIATHCNTLQHTTTHCNTRQHTATHLTSLQRATLRSVLSPHT